ncbi:MAG: peptidoglycan-binding protein, partial [Clostridia bacterium]|nr:peptidoglycan-binding protein [Clostridia bacterium]
SFPDYIKNVASSEIYPTWPDNALRANIYAQITFALNRVFTEFYRSRGYDFDITNNTQFDQSFVEGRDYFSNISDIVDEIFDSYIVRRGNIEPLFARYCNRTTSTCEGLSQWGTVPLAEAGLNPYDILRNFYGDDIDIVTNVPVMGITASVPPRPLRIGSAGNAVRSLQIRLNRIATDYPSIPKIYPTDGVFAQSTEDAVRRFQEIFGLGVDGVVGKATWYRIQYIYNAVKRLSELNSEGLKYEEVARQYPGELTEGDRGEYISLLQYLLSYIGLYESSLPSIAIDGIFGPRTRAAVEAAQELFGLPVTGSVDIATYTAIYDAYRGIITSLPDSAFVGIARPYPGFQQVLGSEGEDVAALQSYLNVISEVYTSVPSVTEDGIYGPATAGAVSAIQRELGLPVTGTVNAETWIAIASLYNDIESGNTVADGQFSG